MDPSIQPSPIEQQLVRFALEHDGEFRVAASYLREAINTGEASVPEKGPITKGSALLEILEAKERLTGAISEQEAELAESLANDKIAALRCSLGVEKMVTPDEGREPAIRTYKLDRTTGDQELVSEQPIADDGLKDAKAPRLKMVRRGLPDGKTVGEALDIPDNSTD